MITRRQILIGAPLGMAGLTLGMGRVKAATAALKVAAPNSLVAGILVGVGGDLVDVHVDVGLSPTEIRIGDRGPSASVTDRIMLKGSGAARARFLDDGRNATRVGANIRKALIAAAPAHEAALVARHRAWAHPLARAVVDWTRALATSSVAGRRMRDDHDRQYLLEWAGATVDPDAGESPSGLARLPRELESPTPQAYRAYLAALVRALV